MKLPWGIPGVAERLDLVTGERIPWRTFQPEDATGMLGMVPIYRFGHPALDVYAYRYSRHLQDLYLVEGLR
jgi:hypothetical protein